MNDTRPDRLARCDPAADDDASLVAEARAGSIDAWARLVLRHRPIVERVARSYGCGGGCDAEDVASDVMAALWSALARGAGPTRNIAGYLAVSTRRAVAHQRHRALREPPVDDVKRFADASAVELAVPDEELIAAFRQLNPRHRLVLWWTLVEGRKPQEYAAELGLSPNAAAAVALRARQGLSRGLGVTAGAALDPVAADARRSGLAGRVPHP